MFPEQIQILFRLAVPDLFPMIFRFKKQLRLFKNWQDDPDKNYITNTERTIILKWSQKDFQHLANQRHPLQMAQRRYKKMVHVCMHGSDIDLLRFIAEEEQNEILLDALKGVTS